MDEEKAGKPVTITLEYATTSYANDYYDVPEIGLSKSFTLNDYCPKKCNGSDVEIVASNEITSPAVAAIEREVPVVVPKKLTKLIQLVDRLEN